MNRRKDTRRRLLWLTLFAAAMAFLEATVVVYLRRIHYPETALSLFPMKAWTAGDLLLEIGREIATIVMLFAVAVLAERGWTRRGAAFLFIFGIWDVLYYVWLKVILGWPTALMEWDILFLIPWAWLAPWWTPVVAAVMFVIWGWAVLGREMETSVTRNGVLCFTGGAVLILAAFLAPAWPLLRGGPEAMTAFEPGRFPWGTYLAGVLCLAAGLAGSLAGGREPGSGMRETHEA